MYGEYDSNSAATSSPSTDSDPESPSSPTQSKHGTKKRATRRTWHHALEKHIFNPHEIATLGAPHRRTIYLASLEGHIDRLHAQLHSLNRYPVHPETLTPYKGLNCKTAKGMVAGLQHDIVCAHKSLKDSYEAMDSLTKSYDDAREKQRNAVQAHSQQQPKAETPKPAIAVPVTQRKYSLDSSIVVNPPSRFC